MENKLYKPKNCSLCPAVRAEKGSMICGCKKELKADINNPTEKLTMWKQCPLAWEEAKEVRNDRIL